MSPRIAIIGGGPAGLTLGRLLHLAEPSISFTIFEQDPSASSRSTKGGTLDLHDDTGIAALKAGGLEAPFQKKARYEGEALVIGDKHGNRLFEMQGSEEDLKEMVGARPEIDREDLKDILLESVPEAYIQWGRRLQTINSDGTLTFVDETTAGPFDLVIGADGAWSKVRPMLTDVRPQFSGISGFELHILDPTKSHPQISNMIGRGSYFAYSGGQGMPGQRLGDDSIMVYLWGRYSETFAKDLVENFDADGEKVKQKLVEEFSSWNPEFLDWIRAADSESIRPWPLYELPVGHTWEHRKGFTLIGDSAHLMTPFAGEGVNAAMKDALDLADCIIEEMKNGGDIDRAVKKYEKAAFSRNEESQKETMTNKTLLFRDDAPTGFMDVMMQVMMNAAPEEDKERFHKAADAAMSRAPRAS